MIRPQLPSAPFPTALIRCCIVPLLVLLLNCPAFGQTTNHDRALGESLRDDGPGQMDAEESVESPSGAPPAKRPVPQLRGREPDPASAGDVLLWVPRVLLFPAWVVTEYVIRVPLGWAATSLEESGLAAYVLQLIFAEASDIGVIPTLLYEFRLKPSVGLYLYWDHFLFDDNYLRSHFAFWGVNWLRWTLRNRIEFTDAVSLDLGTVLSTRQDYLFHGLGPQTTTATRSRFGSNIVEAQAELLVDVWPMTLLATSGYASRSYIEGGCCDNPSLETQVERGTFEALPPGYAEGFEVMRSSLELVFDTRRIRDIGRNGLRFEAEVVHAVNPVDPDKAHWLRYGGGIAAYIDTGWTRTLGLGLQARFADPLNNGDIPFTEQIVIGSGEMLENIREGRLIDRSAVMLTVDYAWPIWVWLDGGVDFTVGNVFGEHLEDFAPDLLRYSLGLGLRTIGEPDSIFELRLAIASATFAQGANVETVRLSIGLKSGI